MKVWILVFDVDLGVSIEGVYVAPDEPERIAAELRERDRVTWVGADGVTYSRPGGWRVQEHEVTHGVQRGDGAERRVEAFIEKRHAEIRSCSLGCGEYGQCKANMHGVPSECPARGSAGNAGVQPIQAPSDSAMLDWIEQRNLLTSFRRRRGGVTLRDSIRNDMEAAGSASNAGVTVDAQEVKR